MILKNMSVAFHPQAPLIWDQRGALGDVSAWEGAMENTDAPGQEGQGEDLAAFLKRHAPADLAAVHEVLAAVRGQVGVVRPPEWNRFAHSFMHVFSGGYAAGYYSYKWAEVLAADAFAAFAEAGVFDRATAERFLDELLSQGGSRDQMDAFVAFRGRKPDVRPLLRQHGIAA